jgi:hypothetical protein
MARHKLTEEEKAARRLSKEQAFDTVAKHLKHLSFAELEEVIALSLRYKREKIGKEELRLIKEKEVIEQQLQKLKELDAK